MTKPTLALALALALALLSDRRVVVVATGEVMDVDFSVYTPTSNSIEEIKTRFNPEGEPKLPIIGYDILSGEAVNWDSDGRANGDIPSKFDLIEEVTDHA